jgi:hypothetical protein
MKEAKFNNAMPPEYREKFSAARKGQRFAHFINCWHMNENESVAMWGLYAEGEGVAIRSSYSKLCASFKPTDTKIYIGCVQYQDYDSMHHYNYWNVIDPFLMKRKGFEHERELRAIVWDIEKINLRELSVPPPEKGLNLGVDIGSLVDAIYVSPNSPDHFRETVEDVTRRYNCDKPVLKSSLDDPALF